MPPPSPTDAEALRAPRPRRCGGGPRAPVGPAWVHPPRAPCLAQVLPLLAAVGFIGAPRGASAEPVPGVPSAAVAQLTSEECGTCFTLREYVAKKPKYVYVLFYGMGGPRNVDMLGKFEQTAQEWIHSRVSFAKIDVDRDRAMAEKWMGRQVEAPSNAMFRNGNVVPVEDLGDFERLKNEYHGNPEGQRWWLTKYFGDDPEGTNLHYVAPLKNAKSLKRAMKKGKLFTLVAFFEKAKGDAWEAFHEFAWSAHQPGGVAVADGTRLTELRLGFAAAVGRVDFSVEGAPAPAVALYRRKGGKPPKTFTLQRGQARREQLSSLAEWVAGELRAGQEL